MTLSCDICNSKDASYKCPKCRIPYCCINCFQEHQSHGCEIKAQPEQSNIENSYNYITDDTIPTTKLKLLENSQELQQTLSNPYLRKILLDLDRNANVEKMMENVMKEPIFLEFVDICLKIVQNEN